MPTTQICSETTYTLRFDTMECHPKMEGAFEDVPANRIQRALSIARNAFRHIDVINESTGEIMFDETCSPAWFNPKYSYGDAIDIIHEMCYGD